MKSSPLLKDFTTFIEYITTHEIILSKRNELLARNHLYELNKRMHFQFPDATPISPQTRYPLLHLFYYLVLSGKLLQKFPKTKSGSQILLAPTERFSAYEKLTPTEQFFFLLETFWVYANWEELQPEGFYKSPSFTVPEILESLAISTPGKKISVGQTGRMRLLTQWNYFLFYFMYFGFWETEPYLLYEDYKHMYSTKSIIPTQLGVTLAPILNRQRHIYFWNLPDRLECGNSNAIPGSPLPKDYPYFQIVSLLGTKTDLEEFARYKGKPEQFFLAFAHLFHKNELTKTLPRIQKEYKKGVYLFKVSLPKDVWRKIEIASIDTLLDLHLTIQEAFDFDNDHLYCFEMDKRRRSLRRYTSPDENEGPHVDEVRTGELEIVPGQTFTYIFDYGDYWKFQIKLLGITNPQVLPSRPNIVAYHGKAPKQYAG